MAAVDGDDRARDVARAVGSEEEDDLGDVVRLALELDRLAREEERADLLHHLRLLVVGQPGADRVAEDLCLDIAGRDAVDPHAARAELDRGRLGEVDHGRLRAVVRPLARRRLHAADRRVVDDRPAAALGHRLGRVRRAGEDAEQVDTEHLMEVGEVVLHQASWRAPEMPALLNMTCSPPNRSIVKSTSAATCSGCATSVSLKTAFAPSVSAAVLAARLVDVRDHDRRALGDHALGGAEPDAGGSTGDDGNLAGELIGHCDVPSVAWLNAGTRLRCRRVRGSRSSA